MSLTTAIIAIVVLVLVAVIVFSAIKMISQGEAAVIERLGRYTRTVSGGITVLVPFIDRIRERVDIRERVVSFPPQAVITQDNLTVDIDIVVTFQINDPARAIYGVDDYLVGVEQISVATLRDVVGGMTLEETLTSRDVINRRLRGELDQATTKWGLRISRVELKAIDPPPSVQQSMEMQMKADREKRAMILNSEGRRESEIKTAEGEKQARILAAEGEKHAAILAAEAERQAEILRAEGRRAATYLEAQGQARAVRKLNASIKASKVTPEVLAYRYLDQLPKMADGKASTMWLIPSQFGDALERFSKAMAKPDEDGVFRYEPEDVDEDTAREVESGDPSGWFDTETDPEIAKAVAAATAVANRSVDEQPAPTTIPTGSSPAAGTADENPEANPADEDAAGSPAAAPARREEEPQEG